MPTTHSVRKITNILSTVISDESTLQDVWVSGRTLNLRLISNVNPRFWAFELRDTNNNKRIDCTISEENKRLTENWRYGDNVLVKGRISLQRWRSEYKFEILDRQPFETMPDTVSVGTLIETLRNTLSEHSARVQGKISNDPAITDAGFLRLHLKNTNNVDMIACVLPPQTTQDLSVFPQRGTEVSVQGRFNIFTSMSQYEIQIASRDDIELVPSVPDEDEQTVVDAVHKYFDKLKDEIEIAGLSIEREHEIQFGSKNGLADVVLIDDNGSFAAIAECKGAGYVGHGIEQLKSYLSATDTRLGIFANRADSNQWEFYENRGGNCIPEIEKPEFEEAVVARITRKPRLMAKIRRLEGEKSDLLSQVQDLKGRKKNLDLDIGSRQVTLKKCKQEIKKHHDQQSKLQQEIKRLKNRKSELENVLGGWMFKVLKRFSKEK